MGGQADKYRTRPDMSAPDNRTYTPIGVCPCPVSVRRREQLEVLSDQRDRRGRVWAPVADAESPILVVKLNEISAESSGELHLTCSVACFGETLKGTKMKKPQKIKTSSQEFSNAAHERLRNLLDMAEDAMIERGECQSHETDDALCRGFIEQLAVTTLGTVNFIQCEAETGATIFISGLCNTYGLKKLSNVHERECARQLVYHVDYYFCDFRATLTKAFIEHLQEATDEDLRGYRFEALFQLAAAKIPNARDQIRREFRRRGLPSPMLVGDRVLGQHMSVSRRRRISGPH